MKCIILAGRKGSRGPRPKQFLPHGGAQSLFQETVARNLPLCDEVTISAGFSCRNLVEAQMENFRELTWRLILEEEGCGTYPAILMALFQYAPSELLCVVPSDWAVSEGDYRGDVLKAMEAARQGKLAVVGEGLKRGILIFENGILQREIAGLSGETLRRARAVFSSRSILPQGAAFSKELMDALPGGSIEKEVLSRSEAAFPIPASFRIRTAAMLPELAGREPFVRLKPSFRDYLWGGTRLREEFGKRCDFPQIAESWELSAHPSGESIVTTGVHRGLTFGNYLSRLGRDAWGWKGAAYPQFPILVKFLDAKDDLSIQVHPGDDYALEHEREYGKNEMWYVVKSGEGARVALGFKEQVSADQVRDAVENRSLESLLQWVPAKEGDVFFIPSGTVHAVGKGCFILEVQQSSDVTYRLYDYGRRDRYGNLRELQLEKALEVMDFSPGSAGMVLREKEKEELAAGLLCSCKYFETRLHEIKDELELTVTPESFVSLVFLSGRGVLCELTEERKAGEPFSITYWAGDSVFLPAGTEKVLIKGPCRVVETRL